MTICGSEVVEQKNVDNFRWSGDNLRRGSTDGRTGSLIAGALAMVVVVACGDPSEPSSDATRDRDIYLRDRYVSPPDLRDACPTEIFRDAGLEGGVADGGPSPPDATAPGTRPPTIPRNRETGLALARARIRTMACIHVVYGERAWDAVTELDRISFDLNMVDAPGTLGINRRELECDRPGIGCEEYLDCVGIAYSQYCAQTGRGGAGACVDGDRRVTCFNDTGWGLVTQCRNQGGYCPEGSFAGYGCYFGTCTPGESKCGRGYRMTCEGGFLFASNCSDEITCDPDLFGLASLDCARYERRTCKAVDNSGDCVHHSWCVGSGERCPFVGAPARCVDEVTVEGCTRPGFVSRLNCAEHWAGGRCIPDRGDGGGAVCSSPGNDCVRSAPRCVSGQLRICLAGQYEFISCADLGMTCQSREGVLYDEDGCYFPMP